ncbi:transposase [uncultured Prevotella sp.]|uniref:transposase n=1 Tax=uncultured Prevotella sp. TaxID=159272 RepID=UPI0034597F07
MQQVLCAIPICQRGDTARTACQKSLPAVKSADKWTESQRQRTEILFDISQSKRCIFAHTHSLRMIFSKNCIKDAARLSLTHWYDKVGNSGFKSVKVITATLY